MKISVSLTIQSPTPFAPFDAKDFEKGLIWAKELGVDGIELVEQFPDSVDADSINEKLGSYGFSVATLSTGQMAGEGLMFTAESQAQRAAAVARLRGHIDLSVKIGRPNVTIGLARGIGSKDPTVLSQQIRYVKDCIHQCAEYAKDNGVIINLEPLNRYETNILNTSTQTYELLAELNCFESVGILYDTFHSNIEDADMAGTVEKYLPHISHIHFADSNRMVPGMGHTDFASILSVLKKHNYKHFISLEVLNKPDAETVISNAGLYVNMIRNK